MNTFTLSRLSAAVAAALGIVAHGAYAQQTAEQQLPEVKVQAGAEQESPTGPVSGYVAERALSATKTDTPIIETPQAITVITRDRIEAQGAQTVQDALRYTAGLTPDPFGLDNRGDWSLVRGVQPVQYQDGLRMLFGNYNNTRPDPYALERIEVLKGPSSVLYGQSSIGGVVNLVSKRPLPYTQREVQVQLGNYNRRQLAVDFTGPVDEAGVVSYRLVALGRDSDTQVDHVTDDRMLLAPSLTIRPSANTSLTLLVNLQEDASGSSVGFFPWRGTVLPAPNGRIPTNTFISEPGWDEYKAKQAAAGYAFEHRFDDTWTVRQNLRYSHSEVSYQSIYSAFPRPNINPDGRTINRTVYLNKPTADAFNVDTMAEARLRTGPLAHTVLFGVEYQHVDFGGRTAVPGSGVAAPIDVYDPVYGNFRAPALTNIAETIQKQTGVYVQDQIKFAERWNVIVGARKDWVKSDTENTPANKLDTDATTYRAALLYHAPNGLAPYVSYAESFQPINGFNFYNQPFKPTEGKQYEIGLKYQPRGINALLTVALYDLREQNRRTPDPVNPLNSVQTGEAHVRGIELEGQASLSRRWDVIATYAYTDAEISQSNNAAELGKRLASVPEHVASLWSTYRFNIGNVPGFIVGGGVRYIGSSWDGTDTIETPAVTLFDAMLGYEQGPWRVALNGTNLADKVYETTCLARGDCFYGSRRTVMATATYRF